MVTLPRESVRVLRVFEDVCSERVWDWVQLLAACAGLTEPVTVVTRLRLDAARDDPAPMRQPGTRGAPRKQGDRHPSLAQRLVDPVTRWAAITVRWSAGEARLVEVASGTARWYHPGAPVVPLRWGLIRAPAGDLEPQAVLSTDLTVLPCQIVAWFVLRWQLEVTGEETRAHLGIETQRQWSDLAILRTTPALLGLFSLVTLVAHQVLQGQALPIRQAAWYSNALPTFVATLALVRQQVWPVTFASLSPPHPEIVVIPRALLDRLTASLAFAA